MQINSQGLHNTSAPLANRSGETIREHNAVESGADGDREGVQRELHCENRDLKIARIRDFVIDAHQQGMDEVNQVLASLTQKISTDEQLDICEQGLRSCQYCGTDPVYFINFFTKLLERNLSSEQTTIYGKALSQCSESGLMLVEFTKAFDELIPKLSKPLLNAYDKGLDWCKQENYNVTHFTQGFAALISADLNEEQIKSRLEIYRNNLELCVERRSNSFQFTNIILALSKANLSNEQLQYRLGLYQDGLKLRRQESFDSVFFTKAVIRLINNNLSDEQFKSKLAIYIEGARLIPQLIFDDFTDYILPLLRADLPDEQLKSRVEMFQRINNYRDADSSYCLRCLTALFEIESELPSVTVAIRNFDKAIKEIPLYLNNLYPIINLLTIVYEELNRRGIANNLFDHFLSNVVAHKPSYLRSPESSEKFSREIGQVYEFGLDVFHGLESLTQAARPINDISMPVPCLLQRCLSHFANDSYQLNCSKEKHLDFKFPGASWRFENLKIPEIQKDILRKSATLERLKLVDISSADFDALESSNITIMRGGIILSNPAIKLLNRENRSEEAYSVIIYSDHFDNPTNTVMLLVPTGVVESKITASKVKLNAYKGYSNKLPDIIEAGLDARSLKRREDTINLLTERTIRGGFDFGTGLSHERIYNSIMAYKSIWRKLQLAMSLYDKGYLDSGKCKLEPIKIRSEFRNGFRSSELLLNEAYNWREWFLSIGNKDGTPVLIDADPFRYSDKRNWGIKLDPTAAEGIELTVKTDQGENTMILPDCPREGEARSDWLSEVRTAWGTEVYSRVYSRPLTKALRFYNRHQI